MVDNLRDQLIRDEGDVPYAYQDSLGYWTIGVGFLIDRRKGGRLPDAVRDFWLDYEITEKRKDLERRIPWITALDQTRQDCLLNMAFNLGVEGLLSFKNTLSLVQSGQYEKASVEMLKSRWATQVGNRAKRLSEQMRTGKYV